MPNVNAYLPLLLVVGFFSARLPLAEATALTAESRPAVSAALRLLPPQGYLPALARAITTARESVDVVMSAIHLGSHEQTPAVYELTQCLMEAQARGVSVSVLLDRYADTRRHGFDGALTNDWAYRLLSNAGVSVTYADAAAPLHARYVVIDQRQVFFGTTEWTQSGLEAAVQSDALIQSEALARIFLAQTQQLRIASSAGAGLPTGAVVPLSVKFLQYADLLPQVIARNDEAVFDVYVLLLWHFGAVRQALFTVNLDAVAAELGFFERQSRVAARQQVRDALLTLQDVYWLLTIVQDFSERTQIRLLDYDDQAADYAAPRQLFVLIPQLYWSGGWSASLPLAAKVCLLYAFARQAISTSAPWWIMDAGEISETFGVPAAVVRDGFEVLRHYGLLVRQPVVTAVFAPPLYRLLPLFDLHQAQQTFDALADQHGAERVGQARALAQSADRPYALDAVREFIGLLTVFDEQRIQEAIAASRQADGSVDYEQAVAPLRRSGL